MQEEVLAGSAAQLLVFGHAPTHASRSLADAAVQTDLQLRDELPSPGGIAQAPPDATFGDSPKQRGERQRRYALIRAKLEHMVSSLPERRQPPEANAAAEGHSRPRTHREDIQEPSARLPWRTGPLPHPDVRSRLS